MARYFLDTGVVLGYTFLHDLWRAEAEKVFDSDNSLYLNKVVIYEYCLNSDDNSLEDAEIDWEAEEGRFGEIIQFAEGIKPVLDMKLNTYDDSELTVDTLIDDFIDIADMEEDIDEEDIVEYIRPTLREFILDELEENGGKPLTVQKGREITEALFATIIDRGREKRKEIRDRVFVSSVPKDKRESYASKIDHFISGSRDPLILAEVACLNDRGVLSTIITNDKGHMYSNKGKLDAKIGVNVNHIKDDVADPSLPTSEEPA